MNVDHLAARNVCSMILRRLGRDADADEPLADTPRLDRLSPWSAFLTGRVGVDLPDHGEAWSRAWRVQPGPTGSCFTTLTLDCVPLRIARCVRVDGDALLLDYALTNSSEAPQPMFRCLHPLLAARPGDRIELSASVSRVVVDSAMGLPVTAGDTVAWPRPVPGVDFSRPDLGRRGPACANFFATNVDGGRVALVSDDARQRLVFEFDSRQLPHIGVWVTAGGRETFRRVALEPSTHASDRPPEDDDAIGPVLPSGASRRWQVCMASMA